MDSRAAKFTFARNPHPADEQLEQIEADQGKRSAVWRMGNSMNWRFPANLDSCFAASRCREKRI